MHEKFMTKLIRELAHEQGATVLLEPNSHSCAGMITFKNGKRTFFRQTQFEINSLAASRVADEKHSAAFFLQSFGYPVPEGRIFFHASERHPGQEQEDQQSYHQRTIDEAYVYARSLGMPVIIKPNDLSQGRLVSKVSTKRELTTIARRIFELESNLLVQRFYAGNDYRVMVLDDRVVAALQRIPFTVVGDGVATIRELVAAREAEFARINRPTSFRLDDQRVVLKLRRRRLHAESVVPAGTEVALVDSANLSSGGEAVDLTAAIHPAFADLCVKIASSMRLRLCGVDLLAPDLTAPPSEYVVVEVNRSPALIRFATLGPRQQRQVRAIYAEVLQKLEAED